VGFKSKRAEQATFIGAKVDYLFRTIVSPTGAEYSYEEVSRAAGISGSYLHRLRNSKISNPGRDVIHALSLFFGVNVEYWFSATTYVTEDDQRQAQLAIAHRTLDEGEYTPEQIRFIVQMLEHLRELTGGSSPAAAPPAATRRDEQEGEG
jgi:transcriptional regulator with XRE-family HTH domain